MKKYRIRPVNLHDGNHLCEKAEPPCETVVTLADAEQYAEEKAREAVKREREECINAIQKLKNAWSGNIAWDQAMDAIRSRGVGPAPKLEKLPQDYPFRPDVSHGFLYDLWMKVNEIIEFLQKAQP